MILFYRLLENLGFKPLIKLFDKFEPKLANIFGRFLLKRQGYRPVVLDSNYKFILNPTDMILSRLILIFRKVDEKIRNALLFYSILCNSFLDIGANIGYFTVSIGKKLKPHSKIIAIEPEPENFRLLSKNIQLNNLQCDLCNLAVSNTEGIANFYLHKDNKGMHSLEKINSEYTQSIQVQTKTIDSLFDNWELKEPILVKIDIEGFEYLALQKAQKLLNKRSIIISEFNPQIYRNQKQNPQDFLRMMEKNGYMIFDIYDEKWITPNEYDSVCSVHQKDLLFIKL